ncbi:MAG: DMT family transporter [Gammaproteobacteria bacterium]
MPLWLSITLAAALCQNVRTTLQQKIRGLLSVDGANFVRYLYGAPLALGFLGVLVWGTGRALPALSWVFLATVGAAGLAQIIATSLMIHAFSLRNYAVGTVYSKTETVFVAFFSTFVAGEPLPFGAWCGILVCLAGVMVLTVRGGLADLRGVLAEFAHKGALFGVLSGFFFALAAGFIRESSKLVEGDFLIRGITVLATMNTLQVVMMSWWLRRRDPPQLRQVVAHWRSSLWVGVFSVCGSALWALAMTLENAARVRAVGQVELVFTALASRFVLKERLSAAELWGSALVTGGVVLILVAR